MLNFYLKPLLLFTCFFLLSCQNVFNNYNVFKCKTIENLEFGKRQTIVYYGTSLTAGGLWVNQLNSILFDKYGQNVKAINSAKWGMDSEWGVANIRSKVLDFKPDCVFIEFSINDALRDEPEGLNLSKSNLVHMIDSIYSVNVNCEIILLTMNIRTTDGVIDRIGRYYQIYVDIAKERKILLVDIYQQWLAIWNNDKTLFHYYVPDGIHPTFLAHQNVTIPEIISTIGLN